jgi:hypothetical protein
VLAMQVLSQMFGLPGLPRCPIWSRPALSTFCIASSFHHLFYHHLVQPHLDWFIAIGAEVDGTSDDFHIPTISNWSSTVGLL